MLSMLFIRGVLFARLIPVNLNVLFKYTMLVTYTHVAAQTPVHRLIEYLHEKDLICARRTSRVSARFASAL